MRRIAFFFSMRRFFPPGSRKAMEHRDKTEDDIRAVERASTGCATSRFADSRFRSKVAMHPHSANTGLVVGDRAILELLRDKQEAASCEATLKEAGGGRAGQKRRC